MRVLDAFKQMVKGPTNSYDTARLLFLVGGMIGIISPVVFQAYALHRGQSWDPLAFCTAYGGMLAGILGFGGLGIATKDRGVASAIHTATPQPLGGQP